MSYFCVITYVETNILYKCPFTKRVISDKNQIGSYLRWESKKRDLGINELRELVFIETFGDICTEIKFKEYYEIRLYSLPDFLSEFGMRFKVTLTLIDWYGCKKRTHSESCVLAAIKTKETNIKRYGVDHTFKVPEFQKKREQTYIDKYGVDNPFKMKNFSKKVEKSYIEKYGMTISEYRSVKGKEVWSEKTEEEQREWIKKCSRSISSLEKRIWSILSDKGIKFETQKKIKRFVFDVFLSELNILIEVNGTIFHADPKIYIENDIMPITDRIAKDIWAKDKEKLDDAVSMGYKVIVIWENEMRSKSDECVFDIIYERIIEANKNKVN